MNAIFRHLIFFTLLAIATHAIAEAPRYANEPSQAFMKSWLLLGPFPINGPSPAKEPVTEHLPGFDTDFLAAARGESDAQPSAGDAVGDARWTAHTATTDIIDLDKALGTRDEVAGYAYAEIESAQDTAAILTIGSNDGLRVWLNGRQLYDRWEPGALNIDGHIIPVFLKQGVNRLLLKIEERGGMWQFCARLHPIDSDTISFADLPLFDLAHDDNHAAVLRPAKAMNLSPEVLTNAHIRVYSMAKPDEIIWQRKWTADKPLRIPVDHKSYGKYRLEMDASFAGNIDITYKRPFDAGPRNEHVLIDNGSSNYSIVLASDASDSEKWAAQELQHWLKECTGATLPIVDASTKPDGPVISVGWNRITKKLFPKLKAPKPDDERFRYANYGPDIAIWGGAQRGTMYGVFTFLEREFGCRWYTSRVTVTPARPHFAFDWLDHSEAPGIRVRNDFYFEAFEPVWAARNKVNGAMGYREQVGGVESYWGVHTFYPFMPPTEFYDQHPEYYSLIDGKRIHDHAQLCLTNPDVLDILTEHLLKTIREDPRSLIYDVSQNDWRNPCQCDNCQAIVKEEESESGVVVWFVNQVAERVEKEFPDKFVGTLAYQYTRKPPKHIKPRDNVVIRLCSIECDFAQDFKTSPENAEFLADLQGWAKVAPHLYIWDYVVNFGHYVAPFPNFRVLKSNIQTFRENNTIGIMEQAAYQSRGGEFAELRAYLISKLLWNPDCDDQAVIADFLHGYYGRSGQQIKEYIDLLYGRLTPETRIHIFMKPEPPLFTIDFVRDAEAIFDRAEAVADDEEIRQRVEMARVPVLYLKCLLDPLAAKRDGDYDRLKTIMARENITHFAERIEYIQDFHNMMIAAE